MGTSFASQQLVLYSIEKDRTRMVGGGLDLLRNLHLTRPSYHNRSQRLQAIRTRKIRTLAASSRPQRMIDVHYVLQCFKKGAGATYFNFPGFHGVSRYMIPRHRSRCTTHSSICGPNWQPSLPDAYCNSYLTQGSQPLPMFPNICQLQQSQILSREFITAS